MSQPQAFICDAIRTPFGRYGGALSSVRTDDLGAIPIKALMDRNPGVDWAAVTDVLYGCANQAGEDNRNVAHMSSLLAGLPIDVPGATINRLCGSGLDAVGTAARAIKSAMEAQGAVLVEIKTDAGVLAQISVLEGDCLRTEFKAALDAYLATTPPAVSARSLEALIAFNKTEFREMPLF
eukprot:gene10762-14433_t